MKRARILAALAGLAALGCGAAAPSPPAPDLKTGKPALETDTCRIYTDAGPETAGEISRCMEESWDALLQIAGEAWGLKRPREKALACVYARRQDFEGFLKTRFPDRVSAAAFYADGAKVLYACVELQPGVDAKTNSLADLVRHEATHQWLYLLGIQQAGVSKLPDYWVIEGIPCYVESAVREPAQKGKAGAIRCGDPTHIRLALAKQGLRKGKLQALDAFVRLDQKGMMAEYAYNQAASLVRFFLHHEDGLHRKAFLAYARDVLAKRATAHAFEQHFGKPPSAFDEALKAHVETLGRPKAP